MKQLVKNSALTLLILFLLGCNNSKQTDKNSEKINLKHLTFIDFPNDLVLSEGEFVDGIKLFSQKDSLLFLIYQDSKSGINESTIELFADTSLLLKIEEIRDTITGTLFLLNYVDNSLSIDNLDNDTFISFFYIKKTSVTGFDPLLVNMCAYFEGKEVIIEGELPVHVDWTWNEYYKTTLDKEIKDLPEKTKEKISHKWNAFVSKFKNNVYSD